MTSRKLALVLGMVISLEPAHAAFTDTVAVHTAEKSAWTSVKKTVNEWLNYWQGDEAATVAPTPPASAVVDTKPPVESPVAVQSVPSAPAIESPAPPPTTSSPDQATASNGKVTGAPAVAPLKRAAEAVKALQEQPLFAAKATSSSVVEAQKLRDGMKDSALLKVATPGRAGTSKLAKSRAGVPTVNWGDLKKQARAGGGVGAVKVIPSLDIGTEDLISREDFSIEGLRYGLEQASEFKRLPAVNVVSERELAQLKSLKVTRAFGPHGLQAGFRTVGSPITSEEVAKVKYSIEETSQFQPLALKIMSEDQLKMLAALILFEKGSHCHMIMGLFNQLAQSEKVRTEATYHLGACAADLKMHQSAFDTLAKVIRTEDKEFAADALALLAKDLLVIYEKDFYQLVKGLKNPKALMREKDLDNVAYRMAKGAYRSGDFKTSSVYASQVSEGATFYDDARFLVAMNSFALGDKASALKKLQDQWVSIERRSVADHNIRALVSVNLARMYFAQKNFEKAFEQYMKVPKDHPLWVQALIEQGWTQLANADYAGAIGNMYSLHSPYFKAVYQPESFVVRTIGYLNICQYGDAYKSLSFLEKDYRDWYGKTSNYLTKNPDPQEIYATIKNYIRGKSTDDVDGVPYQVWREMAHRKDFLNVQTALNDKQDETKRYEGVNKKIKDEKVSIRANAEQAKKRFDQVRAQIAKAKVDKTQASKLPQLNGNLNNEKNLTIAYRYQLAILEQSRQGYLEFQNKSQARLDAETANLGVQAGGILLGHAKHMQKEMSRLLDNNEFLRYEVFSGSGENIRYQVAGGKVDSVNRVPASIKPAKMMNWNFDGEFWEDEIGSYRSSLQNNCPVSNQARKTERVPKEQARHIDDDEN